MIIKNLFLLFILFSFSLIFSKSFNLRDSSSAFKISSGSNLILDKAINSITGAIIKDSGAQINGEDLEFEDGSFKDSGAKINITGKLNLGQTKKIILDGGKNFQGKRGEVLQSISVSGVDNIIEGVLFITSDIELYDSNSKVSFNIRNRLDSDIKLNSGSMTLDEDLAFLDNKRIFGPGKVILNGHKLSFGATDLVWNEPLFFEKASDVEINSNVYLEDNWSFSGDSVLCGNSNILCLSCLDSITVRPRTNLLIKDVVLYGISDNKIRCLTDDSTIFLQNVKWIQDGDFTFTRGSLIFLDDVEFIGDGKKFIYQSQMTSTIKQNTIVHLSSGFTFSYDPVVDRKDLLKFEDDTSVIYLDGGNLYASYKGLNLEKGRIIVDKNSIIMGEERSWFHSTPTDTFDFDGITYTNYDYSYGVSGEINIGNNVSDNDFKINILNGSCLTLFDGRFNYKNINLKSFNFINNSSILKVGDATTLNLEQILDITPGKVFLHKRSKLQKSGSSYLIGPTFIYD